MRTPFDVDRLVAFARLAAFAMLAAVSAQAQAVNPRGGRPAIEAPRIGKMIDAKGVLRTVSGVAGNFLAGPAEAQGVAALACAAQACVTAPDAAVLATDGRRAVAYSQQTNQFISWNIGNRKTPPEQLGWNPLQNGDEVLSIRVTPAGANIAIRRRDAVWIVSQEGTALDTLPPEAAGPVLLLPDCIIYARDDAVVLRRPDGTELSFPAPAVRALYAMSPDWVEAAAADGLHALRTTADREILYVLPATVLPGDAE
ncbi:MAG TPA: hypothetical protein VN841_14395 [Bryobacteraceae bacterium]|nr:hypothetical protein [Bryobacteraceae bacterium]